MHRIHAIRLALLCLAAIGVLAACGGQQAQINYGSLANGICLKFSADANSATSPADRLKAIETALSGLQRLNPPDTVQTVWLDLLGNFKAAVDILKPNQDRITRLAHRLQKHPDDNHARKAYEALARPIRNHLVTASADAHKLGLGNCEKAFAGS
jgi:hypothetical protein